MNCPKCGVHVMRCHCPQWPAAMLEALPERPRFTGAGMTVKWTERGDCIAQAKDIAFAQPTGSMGEEVPVCSSCGKSLPYPGAVCPEFTWFGVDFGSGDASHSAIVSPRLTGPRFRFIEPAEREQWNVTTISAEAQGEDDAAELVRINERSRMSKPTAPPRLWSGVQGDPFRNLRRTEDGTEDGTEPWNRSGGPDA